MHQKNYFRDDCWNINLVHPGLALDSPSAAMEPKVFAGVIEAKGFEKSNPHRKKFSCISIIVRLKIFSDWLEGEKSVSDGWWYNKDNDKKGPVSLDQLKALHDAGVFTADTMVWREGHSEWMPARSSELADAFPDWKQTPPPLPGEDSTFEKSETADKRENISDQKEDFGLGFLSGLLRFALNIYTVAIVLEGLNALFRLFGNGESGILNQLIILRIAELEGFQNIALIASLFVLLIYLSWVYLSADKARKLAPDVQKVSPAMTLGAHFIPILWFFKPIEGIMQFMRVAEAGDKNETGADTALIWWWINWIAIGLTIGTMFITPNMLDENTEMPTWLVLILSILEFISVRLLVGMCDQVGRGLAKIDSK